MKLATSKVKFENWFIYRIEGGHLISQLMVQTIKEKKKKLQYLTLYCGTGFSNLLSFLEFFFPLLLTSTQERKKKKITEYTVVQIQKYTVSLLDRVEGPGHLSIIQSYLILLGGRKREKKKKHHCLPHWG